MMPWIEKSRPVNDRAVRLTVLDPSLERNRWTVGFRLILAIPHFFWLAGGSRSPSLVVDRATGSRR